MNQVGSSSVHPDVRAGYTIARSWQLIFASAKKAGARGIGENGPTLIPQIRIRGNRQTD
jgi:hypothetical protein